MGSRNAYLLKTYGITEANYKALLKKQNGKCAICLRPSKPGKNLHVDHDHQSQEIVGLLCWLCNHKFIGRRRNPVLYEAAAKYLRQGTGWFVPPKKNKKKRKRR